MKKVRLLLILVIIGFVLNSCAYFSKGFSNISKTIKSVSSNVPNLWDTAFVNSADQKARKVVRKKKYSKKSRKSRKNKGKIKSKKSTKLVSNSSSSADGKAEITMLSSSKYIAKLGSKWQTDGFKYVSINGDRYTFAFIKDVISENNIREIFYINSKGELLVRLDSGFDLKIAFYKPNTDGHMNFSPFKVKVLNGKRKTVESMKIDNRIKRYNMVDKGWK